MRVFSYNYNWTLPFKYTFNNINDWSPICNSYMCYTRAFVRETGNSNFIVTIIINFIINNIHHYINPFGSHVRGGITYLTWSNLATVDYLIRYIMFSTSSMIRDSRWRQKKKKWRIPNIIFFPDKKGDLMKMLVLFFLIEFSTRLVKFDELNCVKQNLAFKTYFSLNHIVSKLYTHMIFFFIIITYYINFSCYNKYWATSSKMYS